jgi:hypothetical protein
MTEALVRERAEATLAAVLAWSRARDYRGHTKHDALLSPFVWTLAGWSKWSRILAIQAVMRAPVNVRSLLGVPPSWNPKGLGLFLQACLLRHRASGDAQALAAVHDLYRKLMQLRSQGPWSGICWGYQYPWQDLGFFAATGTPNAVVTAHIGEALLDAFVVSGERRYLDTVSESLPFFLHDLTVLKDEPEELCLAYMPLPMRMRVMDVSILIGALLARHAALSNDATHLPVARRLVEYVVRRQTDYGAWYYTDPPKDSPITHDNYHTGFILDALWRYMQATGDARHERAYQHGLRYYHEHLFNADGSPRWMNDKDYPHDIHGAAQGILTFARHEADYPGFAAKVVLWALERMYHPEGRFYYQETRYYRKTFTLMRWCNAWMARALSVFLYGSRVS